MPIIVEPCKHNYLLSLKHENQPQKIEILGEWRPKTPATYEITENNWSLKKNFVEGE